MNVPSLEALAEFPFNLMENADLAGPLLANANDEAVEDEPVRAAA